MIKKYVSAQPMIEQDDIAAVVEVLKSGHLEEGARVRNFEKQVSAILSKTYAQATVNGFSSIHILFLSLGLNKGDEVIIPSYCCPAVLYPIKLVGAMPVFADIEANSFNMSVDTIRACLSPRAKVILYPYQFGFPGAIDDVIDTFKDCIVIEDIAQSFGATYKGQMVGSFAEHTVASFYASKMLTCGDAGMVVTDNNAVYEQCKMFTYYGGHRGKQEQGYNYHLTNLNAALGLSQLQKLERFVKERKTLAKTYDAIFEKDERIQIDFSFRQEAAFLKYPVRLESEEKRNALKAALSKKGISCGYGVLEALHEKEGRPDQKLVNTNQFIRQILCLPIYPSLEKTDIEFIAETVLSELNHI